MKAVEPAERVLHFAALFFLVSLIATYGLQRLAADTAPFFPAGLGILIAQTAPLLACLPAVLRGNRTGALVLALIALVYFAVGVWTLVDPDQRLAGTAEIMFALGLFAALSAYLGAQGRRLAQEADAEASAVEGLPEKDP